jgi:hypothetical protein
LIKETLIAIQNIIENLTLMLKMYAQAFHLELFPSAIAMINYLNNNFVECDFLDHYDYVLYW